MAKLEKISRMEEFKVPEGYELVPRTKGRYLFSNEELPQGEEVIVVGVLRGRDQGVYSATGRVSMADFDRVRGERYVILNGAVKHKGKDNSKTVYSSRLRDSGNIYRRKK